MSTSLRRALLLPLALLWVASLGCIKLEQVWTVYPDGSGKVRMRVAIAIPGATGEKAAEAPNIQHMVREHYLFQDLEGLLVKPDYQSEFADGKILQAGEALFSDINRVRERGRPVRSNSVRLEEAMWGVDATKLKRPDVTGGTAAFDPAAEEVWVSFAKTDTEKVESWRLDIRVTTPEGERWIWRRMGPPYRDQARQGIPFDPKLKRPPKMAVRKGAIPRIQLCGLATLPGDDKSPGNVHLLKLKFLDDQGKSVRPACQVDIVAYDPPQQVARFRKLPDGGCEVWFSKTASGRSKVGGGGGGDAKAPGKDGSKPPDPKADPKKDPPANPPKEPKGDNPITGEPHPDEAVKRLVAGFSAGIAVQMPGPVTKFTGKQLDARTFGVQVDEKIFLSEEARKEFQGLEIHGVCGKPTDEALGEWEGFKGELQQAIEDAKAAAGGGGAGGNGGGGK